jgi:hypothetical protein
MGTKGNGPAAAGDKGDDLTKIAGIGSSWANALRKVGVRRFRDFAQYTPAELSRLLETVGYKASLEKTEKWIEEARERTWETHAQFSIFFEYKLDEHGVQEWQTRVYGEGETKAGTQEPFPGLEPAVWTTWILEQANLPVLAPSLSAQVAKTSLARIAVPDEAQIEILGLRVSEIEPPADAPDNRLEAELSFRVSGSQASERMQERMAFQIELYTVALESGAFDLIAFSGGRLKPDVFEYSSRLAFPLPELGGYIVHAVVHLLPPGERIASWRGPRLTVVP